MTNISRREFGKVFAVAAIGNAAPRQRGYDSWAEVQNQFTLEENLIVMNAANLCPAPASVNEVLFRYTRDIDSNPSFPNRAKFGQGREDTRAKIAAFLNVTPEEIVITRNTSEGNNFVSSGLELESGDEVVIFDENHPTNNQSWKDKAERFGFTVKAVSIPTPPPSAEAIIEGMVAAMGPRTRVLAFTHVTNSFGTRFPAKELCGIARERGILTLVDGAQTFGVLDLDLQDMGCDFFTGSSHKWLMGPKEAGVLYMRSDAQERMAPSEVGVIGGRVGASRVYERLGQRDDPAIMAFGEAIDFLIRIGKERIERRSVGLATALKDELGRIPGVHMYSPTTHEISSAVVTFRPGDADIRSLNTRLYEDYGIACATRGGSTAGFRFSPHIYNDEQQVERVVAAFHDAMRSG